VGELVSASVSSVLWERSCGFVVLSESFFNDCQVITEKKAKAYEFLKKFGLESESTFLTHQGTRLHCMFKNQTTLQEALDFEFPFRVVRCFGQGGTLCNHSLQKFDWLLTTYVGVRRGSNREEFVEARENIRKHITEQAERAKCQIDFIRFSTREFGHIISVAPRNQVSFRKILDGALNYRGRPMIFRAPNSSQAPKSQPNKTEIWTRFYMKHTVDMFVLKNVIGQKVPKLKLVGGLGESEDQAPSLLIHLVSESEQVASEQREQFLEAWSEICWKEHTHLVRPDRFRHDCSACGKAGHKRAKCPVAMSIRKGQAVPLHGDEKSKAPDCGSTRAWSVSRSAALSKSLQSKMESSNCVLFDSFSAKFKDDRSNRVHDPDIEKMYEPLRQVDEAWYSDLMQDFTINELKQLGSSLKKIAAPADDKVSAGVWKILLDGSKWTATVLSLLFNSCLRLRYFPQIGRSATIVPLLKKQSEGMALSNIRPISLQNAMMKILSKGLAHRLAKIFSRHDILHPAQEGFLKGGSTGKCIDALLDVWEDANLHKKECISIFYDLAGAYDTVPHDRLLASLARIKLAQEGMYFDILRPGRCLRHRSSRSSFGQFGSNQASTTLYRTCQVQSSRL